MEASIRHSQFDVPISISSPWQDSVEDRLHSRIHTTLSPTDTSQDSAFTSPLAYNGAQTLYQPPLPPPPPLSRLIQPQRSQTEISQLSSSPGSPVFTRPFSYQRSPSPVSEQQETPPNTSYLASSPHLTDSPRTSCPQPDFSEKEVLPEPCDTAYSLPAARHPREAQDPLELKSGEATEMNWFRRNSKDTPPARFASIATADEKWSVEQSTGVVSSDEKQPIAWHPVSLSSQISQARSARVNTVVDHYIEPLLQEQAANGLTRSTFVIIPEIQPSEYDYRAEDGKKAELFADFGTLIPKSETRDLLIGFPTELNIRVVRLHPTDSGHTGYSARSRDALGDEGTRFWQQPSVCTEMDRLLKIRLVGMGLDVLDPSGVTTPFRKDGWAERGEQVGGTPNIEISHPSSSRDRWKGGQWEAGMGIWKSGGTQRAQSSWQVEKQEQLLAGQASVRVSLEDVCFRTQSAMGLYDTKTDKAIVVRVNIEG